MEYSPGVLTEYDKEQIDATSSSNPTSYSPADEARGLLVAAGVAPRSSLSGPDPYQYLMSREDRVLKTLNRVVDDNLANRHTTATTSLFAMPVHEIAMRTAGSLRSLLDDLLISRSIDDVKSAMFDPIRTPYLGLALVAIAILLGMIEIMS